MLFTTTFPLNLLRLRDGYAFITIVMALFAFFVLFPVAQILWKSMLTAEPAAVAEWSLEGWRKLVSDRGLYAAALNTMALVAVRVAFALPIGIAIAWLLARTDVPGARTFEFVFWLALFLPSLTVTLGWILLLESDFGLLNQLLRHVAVGLDWLPLSYRSGPFNIQSFMGIVWIHLVATDIPFTVMMLTPAFRNMNSALEEASRISGAGNFRTIIRILVPLMAPAIVAVLILSILLGMQSFEIERVLGPPADIEVFSTWIYDRLYQVNPQIDEIYALATSVMLLAFVIVFIQRGILGGREYATVSGKQQAQVLRLRKWRWIALVFLCLITALVLVVPAVFSVMGTFMKLFGFFIEQPWTWNHWQTTFNDSAFIAAAWSTLILGVTVAGGSVVIHTVLAYVVVHTRYPGRKAVDFISWLPFTVPGIVLSLGLLAMSLLPPFRPLYGSISALVLALIISGTPLGVQITKAALAQLGKELEEASWVTGGNRLMTYVRIVLPLISPTLVVVAVMSFISAARNISQVVLLSTSANRPLSVMQLDYLADGRYGVATVIATVLLAMSIVLALLARFFGYRGMGAGGR